MNTAVALVTLDGSGKPVPGVIAYLKAPGIPGGFLFAITNTKGYALWDSVPVPFAGVLQFGGAAQWYGDPDNGQPVSIPDLQNITIRVGGADGNPQDVHLPPCVPSFKSPGAVSRAAFRASTPRGNCGGMVLPGLGLSTHDALFDPMTPWYPEAVQQAIFDAKRAAGLNVIGLCGWADYHGSEFGMPIRYDWVQDADGPAQARAYCIKLRRAGFLPLFWLLGDRVAGDAWDSSGGSCDQALSIIRALLPALKDVVGAASPGFELRGPGNACPYSAKQYWRMLLLMNELAPDLYKFGHFTLENSAGSSHSPVEAADPWQGNEIDFWAKTDWPEGSTQLDGFFYQAPTDAKLFDGTGQWQDRWQECLDRIGPDKLWHVVVDCCWGEAGWYNITRGDNPASQLLPITAAAMQMGGRFSFSG